MFVVVLPPAFVVYPSRLSVLADIEVQFVDAFLDLNHIEGHTVHLAAQDRVRNSLAVARLVYHLASIVRLCVRDSNLARFGPGVPNYAAPTVNVYGFVYVTLAPASALHVAVSVVVPVSPQVIR